MNKRNQIKELLCTKFQLRDDDEKITKRKNKTNLSSNSDEGSAPTSYGYTSDDWYVRV